MVDWTGYRYFDPRFLQFGLTALVLKIAIYLIQSHTNSIINNSNMDSVSIARENSSAKIHLFGATLTSWIVDGQDMLFVSKNSVFNGKKAIRGGVPVVFPQFGPWQDGPQHGFARISRWTVKDHSKIGTESITLVLENSDATKEFWDHKFRFEYTLSLVSEKQLKMDVMILNTDISPFSFTFLLHTYFSVPDVSSCQVSGLSGCSYIDKVKDGNIFKEERSLVTISDLTDRIYINTPVAHKVKYVAGNKVMNIDKFNLPDTVVWNPWSDNAKSMSDFGDDEWKIMICVEVGAVNTPVVLEPKKVFVASQILSVE